MGEFLSKVQYPFEKSLSSCSGRHRRGAWIYFCQQTDRKPTGRMFTLHGSTRYSKQTEQTFLEAGAARATRRPGATSWLQRLLPSWARQVHRFDRKQKNNRKLTLKEIEFLHQCENCCSDKLKSSIAQTEISTKKLKRLNESLRIAMSGWMNTFISRTCFLNDFVGNTFNVLSANLVLTDLFFFVAQ